MAKIYKISQFQKWQRKNKIPDNSLIKAIEEIENGLVDAKLGGNLFKKRIAKSGMGKRSAYRTIIACKQEIGWVFMFGFEKNELDNINKQTLDLFKSASTDLFLNFYKFIRTNMIFEVLKE